MMVDDVCSATLLDNLSTSVCASYVPWKALTCWTNEPNRGVRKKDKLSCRECMASNQDQRKNSPGKSKGSREAAQECKARAQVGHWLIPDPELPLLEIRN